MKRKHLFPSLGALATLILLASASLVQAEGERHYEQRLAAAKDGTVSVENVAGAVTVNGWDRAEIEVVGTLGEDVKDLDFTVDGRAATIKVILPRRSRGDNAADLEIKVPRDSRLKIETVSADIEVAGVRGDLDLNAVSGEVTADDAAAEIDAQSISGTVTLTGRPTLVHAESVSGDIELTGGCSDCELSTVSGNVTLRSERPVSSCRGESVSGDLVFDGALESDGKLTLETHSGEILVTLPEGTKADFNASTFSGDIDNGFGPRAKRTDRFTPGKELRFSTGGGARVDLTSFSGDVRLEAR